MEQKTDFQGEIVEILRGLMNEIEKDYSLPDEKYGKPFADTIIHTDKVMTYVTNDDEAKGWTGVMSNISEKPKDSNVVILVTYDGAGYDYFSYSGDGNGFLKNKFREELEKKFGKRFVIEDCNNWAFEVYDMEVD